MSSHSCFLSHQLILSSTCPSISLWDFSHSNAQLTSEHAFGIWDITEAPTRNQCSYREKVHTPHKQHKREDQTSNRAAGAARNDVHLIFWHLPTLQSNVLHYWIICLELIFMNGNLTASEHRGGAIFWCSKLSALTVCCTKVLGIGLQGWKETYSTVEQAM